MSGRPCAACGADIRWAITRTGKRIPIDAEPNERGNVELVGVGHGTPTAIVHGGPPGMFDQWQPWMPHHATCPNWRTNR